MMNEEEYVKTLIEMWDSLRTEHKGNYSCIGVQCECCPLRNFIGCNHAQDIFDIYNTVEKWSKENPPKKYKVSRMEYDILQTVINFGSSVDTFNDFCTLSGLLEKGYFDGATGDMYISDYYNNCEVVD